jgi:hypothetical protein
MSFEAKYPGRCGACGEPIYPGDHAKYEDDELIHAHCDVVSLPKRDDLSQVCRHCWTIHVGECL